MTSQRGSPRSVSFYVSIYSYCATFAWCECSHMETMKRVEEHFHLVWTYLSSNLNWDKEVFTVVNKILPTNDHYYDTKDKCYHSSCCNSRHFANNSYLERTRKELLLSYTFKVTISNRSGFLELFYRNILFYTCANSTDSLEFGDITNPSRKSWRRRRSSFFSKLTPNTYPQKKISLVDWHLFTGN